jgi:hypothetical protein
MILVFFFFFLLLTSLASLYTMSRPALDMDLISTGHSAFLKPSLQEGHPARSLILRGINLSSTAKFPHYTPDAIPDATGSRTQRDHRRWMRAGVKSHEPDGLWDEAESGGHEGWFNGAPFPLDEADVSQPNRGIGTDYGRGLTLGTSRSARLLGLHDAEAACHLGGIGACRTVSDLGKYIVKDG